MSSYWRGGNWTASDWDDNNWLGPNAASAGGDVSVGLTGLRATSAQGALTPEIEKALTGLAATTAYGVLTPEQGTVVALTGLAATTAAGLLQPEASLSGLSLSTASGALVPELAVALTGLAATATAGVLAGESLADGTLVGQGASAYAGQLGVALDVALVGAGVLTRHGTLHIPYESYDNGVWKLEVPVELWVRPPGGELFALTKIAGLQRRDENAEMGFRSDCPTLSVLGRDEEFSARNENAELIVTAGANESFVVADSTDLFVCTTDADVTAQQQDEALLAA